MWQRRWWVVPTVMLLGCAGFSCASQQRAASTGPSDNALPLRVVPQRGHMSPIESLSVSPDDALIASVDKDGTLKLWDTASERLIHSVNDASGPLAWHPNSTQLAYHTRQGALHVQAMYFRDGPKAVAAQSDDARWSADGAWLAVAQRGELKVLDATRLQTHQTLDCALPEHLAWSPTSNTLAARCKGDHAHLWRAKDGALLHTLPIPPGASETFHMAWSPSGGQLLIGQAAYKDPSFAQKAILAMGQRPDSQTQTTALVVYDANSGREVGRASHEGLGVMDVSWHPTLPRFAGVVSDCSLQIWDAKGALIDKATPFSETCDPFYIGGVANMKPHGVAWSPDGQRLLVRAHGHTRVGDGEAKGPWGGVPVDNRLGDAMRWSSDSATLVGSDNNQLVLVDPNQEQPTRRLGRVSPTIQDIAWSHDGDLVASATSWSTDEGGVHVWDARSGTLAGYLRHPDSNPHKLYWSPDDAHLATEDGFGMFSIWDVRSRTRIFQVPRDNPYCQGSVDGMFWNPDSRAVWVRCGTPDYGATAMHLFKLGQPRPVFSRTAPPPPPPEDDVADMARALSDSDDLAPAAWNPHAPLLAARVSSGVWVLDVSTPNAPTLKHNLIGTSEVTDIAWGSRGKALVLEVGPPAHIQAGGVGVVVHDLEALPAEANLLGDVDFAAEPDDEGTEDDEGMEEDEEGWDEDAYAEGGEDPMETAWRDWLIDHRSESGLLPVPGRGMVSHFGGANADLMYMVFQFVSAEPPVRVEDVMLEVEGSFGDAQDLWNNGVSMAWDPTGTHLAGVDSEGNLHVWRLTLDPDPDMNLAYTKDLPGRIDAVRWSTDGQTLTALTSEGSVHLNAATGAPQAPKAQRATLSHDDARHARSPNRSFVATDLGGALGLTHVSRATTWVLSGGLDGAWLTIDEAGYFTGSARARNLVALARGPRGYSVEQLAAVYNRPDKLLAAWGGPPDLVAFYEALWKHRLTQQGLNPDTLTDDFSSAPSAVIRDVSAPTPQGRVTLDVALSDPVAVQGYRVFVNGSPTTPDDTPAQGKQVTLNVEVTLTRGVNTIELVALGSNGIASLRDARSVTLTQATLPKPRLFFLGFGVSDYADDTLDLKYAKQDVEDLAKLIQPLKGYASVEILTLTDAQVTLDGLETARRFVAGVTEHDSLVMFIAGHGARDDDALRTYYYLGHNTDPEALADTALPFKAIESLLYDAKARQKLFLIDTCQSGVTLPTPQAAAPLGSGVKARSIRGFKLKAAPTASEHASTGLWTRALTERDRFITQDLRRLSGATVLASSLGQEASLESPTWQNGAFTEVLLQTLSGGEADTNNDGRIDTEELARHVTRAVPKLTGDRQHPNVERDNPLQQFTLPAAP